MARLARGVGSKSLHLLLRVVVDEAGVGGQVLRRRRHGDGDGRVVIAGRHYVEVVYEDDGEDVRSGGSSRS